MMNLMKISLSKGKKVKMRIIMVKETVKQRKRMNKEKKERQKKRRKTQKYRDGSSEYLLLQGCTVAQVHQAQRVNSARSFRWLQGVPAGFCCLHNSGGWEHKRFH
jgi:predicted DNA-binding antitoxin AbrB/MazE fold protein